MNKSESSFYINRCRSYFNSTKINNPKKYRAFKLFGRGDLAKGYLRYTELINSQANKINSIYYELTEAREVQRFSDFAYKHSNMFKSPYSVRVLLDKSFGWVSNKSVPSVEVLQKRKELILMYEGYKEMRK